MKETVSRRLTSGLVAITILFSWGVVTTKEACAVGATSEGTTEGTTQQSVDVVFVLDNSGSMRKNDPGFLTRAAVAKFASALAEDPEIDGRIAVVLFDGQARLVRDLIEVESGETDTLLLDALAELDFSGQRTNSPAGIERALYEFRQNGRADARRAIVLLTDGKIDTGDSQTDLEAARWLREDLARESEASGIRIFGVAFTDAADYQLMQALARRTNARYYRAFEASELSSVVDDVLSKIADKDFHEPPLADATAPPPSESGDTALPDVAAAPLPDDDQTPIGLLGLLPVAVFLVAGSLLWRRRSRAGTIDPQTARVALDMDAPAAQLLDVGGQIGEAGSAIELLRGRTRIGRDSHNEVALDDDTISSEHAIIEIHGGRYWLEDQRSTNGTRLGDQRLEPGQRVLLKGGDHIRLADIDLMFVLAGYVPGGATVFLNSATQPPENWMASLEPRVDEAFDAPIPEPEAACDDAQASLEPDSEREEIIEPDESPSMSGQLSLLRTPDPEAKPDLEPENPSKNEVVSKQSGEDPPPVPGNSETYRRSLDYHLERVSEISPAFAAFIERAFDEEIRGALCVSARDLTTEAEAVGQILQKTYTFDRVRFVICGVPGGMETARDFYVEAFGGFTRMLTEQLQADSFRTDRCEILAVLTFGLGDHPWVSLSIVPDDGQDPRIDLLSYEFLTDEERQEIGPSEHTDLSQSGLG